MEVRLADDDRAGFLESPRDVGVLVGNAVVEHLTRGRGSRARGIDVVRAGDVDGSPGGATDIDVLAWAAVHERIIVSLDHDTLPNYFAAFLAAGNSSPGLIMLHGFLSILELSEILVLVCIANNSDEYRPSDSLYLSH